jgi:CRISPR-associated endonuclease Csn1
VSEQRRYRVGIDVGLNSVGLAAIEVAEDGTPTAVRNAVVFIHDAGVDPDYAKTAASRLAVSGVARRARRLVRRKRERLEVLDRFIESQGWPLLDFSGKKDPWLPWNIRAKLASEPIENPEVLEQALSVALRHLARHRGWRSPWEPTKTLLAAADPSKLMVAFQDRIEAATGIQAPQDATPAQLVDMARAGGLINLRREAKATKPYREMGAVMQRLHQSDYARELRRIAEVQGLDNDLFEAIVEVVFRAKSPKGAAAARAGKDPLREKLHRAPKATLAFQRFRIAAVLANVRIHTTDGKDRPLTVDERLRAFELLYSAEEQLSWTDVALALDLGRRALTGTATASEEGEPVSTRPPINATERHMRECSIKPIKSWWLKASADEKEALVELLSKGMADADASPAALEAEELLQSLSPEDLAKLEGLKLPQGRAAYSSETLRDLADRMLSTEEDLHTARKTLFKLPDDWKPPVEAIGEPVGNPAVDRVLKIIARWLLGVERRWGAPQSINIEHVREAFSSEATARQTIRDSERRFAARQRVAQELYEKVGQSGEMRNSDVRRLQAIQRQNGQCLYCGTGIDFQTAEMDHIVPRAGAGSTNTTSNLVAVCGPCNKEKSNRLFSEWAAHTSRPNVSLEGALERVDHFIDETGLSPKERGRFKKAVKDRLRATEKDEPVDSRSIESVAWMANQLHLRIANHFRKAGQATTVQVFRGWLTSEARKASGLEGRIELIGGRGKTRLDRRHHAVDAAVTAMMRQGVAQILSERQSIRAGERDTRSVETWKSHGDQSPLYAEWLSHMESLTWLLNEELREDRIPVTEMLRLRLGSGAAHDATINPLVKRSVSSAMPVELIDRASTPALWCALTRLEDFDPTEGLPEDPARRIRVKERHLGPNDQIAFFGSGAAAIEVRGGYAEIGGTIHHARIYKITSGKKSFFGMVRVFRTDLLQHRSEDLFQVPLLPQGISLRTAERRIREAVLNGAAEYIGWLVEGDELLLDLASQKKGQVADLLGDFPSTSRWRVSGFPDPALLRLRPRHLASEGLTPSAAPGTEKILKGKGWRPAINVIMTSCSPVVIRRDSLGKPRLQSGAHLPVTWRAPNSD